MGRGMRRTRLLYCGDAHGNNAGDKQFQIKGNIYVRAVMSLIICDDFTQTISTVTIRAYSQKKRKVTSISQFANLFRSM